jgi:ABC-type nitrate/sulfonate/bicarbonate transport system permease component
MTPELHADGTRPASRRPRIVDLIVQRPELATVPLAFVVALLAWHWLTILLHVDPIVFPGPMPVARALVAGLASGAYGHHFWITFKEVLGGFAIGCGAGLVLGAVISQFRILEKTVFPYFVALQTVPKLAIAPLFVVWFGAQGGIGFMILQYNFQLETAKVFALIVVLSVTGIALHNVVRWLHRRTVFWIKPDDVVGA